MNNTRINLSTYEPIAVSNILFRKRLTQNTRYIVFSTIGNLIDDGTDSKAAKVRKQTGRVM